jgi:hypothetical protein
MRYGLLGLGLVGCLLARPARAQPQREGVHADLGVRGGYSIPLGKGGADATEDLNQSVAGVAPLWLELGVRAIPQLTIGAFGVYGAGIIGDTIDGLCKPYDLDCSATQLRFGAQARFHPLAYHSYDPWIGIGIGYESLTFTFEDRPGVYMARGGELTLKGFQPLNLQGGIDFQVSRRSTATVGLFVDYAIAAYSDVSCFGTVSCGGINKTTHQWLTFGIRAAFVP